MKTVEGRRATTTRSSLLALLLLLCIGCLCAVNIPQAWATEGTWSGSGTAETPYQIADAADMQTLATNVNGGTRYSGQYFKLTGDIDLSGIASWAPVGASSSYPFAGVFDGDGHTITGLTVTSGGGGLFGYVTGTSASHAVIQNTILEGNIQSTSSYTGAFGSRVENAEFRNLENRAAITSSASYVGGIVGYQGYAPIIIDSCLNSGAVTCTYSSSTSSARLGGIIGWLNSSSGGGNGDVTNCYNTGTIRATNAPGAGGIVGQLYNSSTSYTLTVQNCYNTGTVSQGPSASYSYYGGIYGNTSSTSSTYAATTQVINCYSLDTACDQLYNSITTGVTLTDVASKTDAEMRTAGFVTLLGDAFMRGDDYPLLVWQIAPGTPNITAQPVPGPTAYLQGEVSPQALSVEVVLPAEGTTGADGALTYQWYRATQADLSDAAAITDATADSCTPATDILGTFYYYCVITNTFTVDEAVQTKQATSAAAQIVITSATPAATPVITAQPQSLDGVSQDREEVLSIEAGVSGDGAGTLSYQWYKATGEEAAPDTDEAISGATEDTYNPPTADLGSTSYYCVVTNTFETVKTASVTSNLAKVTVIPLQIATADDFAAFAASVNGGNTYAGKTVQLADDIDLSSIENQVPVGTSSSRYFAGTFDGQGHAITGLSISGTTYQGLFGYIGATTILKNFTVAGSVTGTQYVGGVVGQAHTRGFLIENVGSGVDVVATGSTSDAGGLIGRVYYPGTVKSSYFNGSVSAAGSNAGGICGNLADVLTLSDCYNVGTVTGTINVGGIYGTTGSYASTITNCYNAGTVTATTAGTSYVGAIGGRYATLNTRPALANVYYDSEVSSYGAVQNVAYTGATAKATDELKANSMPAALNVEVFTMDYHDINSGYPVLTWEIPEGTPIIVTNPVSPTSDGQVLKDSQPSLTIDATPPVEGQTGHDGQLSYQWYVMVGAAADLRVDTVIADAVSTSYAIPTGELGLTTYYCVVTNTYGTPAKTATNISKAVTIAVVTSTEPATPSIMSQPIGGSAQQDAQVTPLGIEANVSGDGAGTLSYQWYRAAGEEAAPETDEAISGATEAAYNPPTADTGSYRYYCVVTNTFETVKTASIISDVVAFEVMPREIATAEQLAVLAQSTVGGDSLAGKHFILTADIDLSTFGEWTPIGSQATPFKGVFDGSNHTISGITVTGSNDYAGLFGYISAATVENFVVEGNVTGGRYVAGTVGYAAGGSTIRNVGNEATVSGGWYVGGIAGYSYAASTTPGVISGCYNRGAISASQTSAAYLGGIAGNSYYTAIENCYNLSDLSAAGYYIGGISGNASTGTTIKNCYGAGAAAVTGSSYTNAAAPVTVVTNTTVANAITSSYYNTDKASRGVGYTSTSYEDNTTGKSTDEMQGTDFLGLLNTGVDPTLFKQDLEYKNGGYPVLVWEENLLTYDVDITVIPKNSTITVIDSSGKAKKPKSSEEVDGAMLHHYKLYAGEMQYTVAAYGYVSQSGISTVSTEGANSLRVTLAEAEKHAVTFNPSTFDSASAASATVTVRNAYGDIVEPTSGWTYSLPAGDFTYTGALAGYGKVEGSFAVGETGQTIDIVFNEEKTWDGSLTEPIDMAYNDEGGYYDIHIYMPSELAWVANKVNTDNANYGNAHVTLEKDFSINDASGTQQWQPIGNSLNTSFAGSFDGKNHRIEDMYIDSSGDPYGYGMALFGYAGDCEIKNVVVTGTVKTSAFFAAGIVAVCNSGLTTISDCGSEVAIETSASSAAGIVGTLYTSSSLAMNGCYNKGSIEATGASTGGYLGGLIGMSSGTIAEMENCYNTGAISTIGSQGSVGGLIGSASDTDTLEVKNVFNIGTVSVPDTIITVGSLAGRSDAFTYTNAHWLSGTAGNAVGNNYASEASTITNAHWLSGTAGNAVGGGYSSDTSTITEDAAGSAITAEAMGAAFAAAAPGYNGGACRLVWETDSFDISTAEIAISDVVYTGSAAAPVSAVTLNSITLDPETDYTVSYKKAEDPAEPVDVGTYTAVITGTGTYAGSIEREFAITPADLTVHVTGTARVVGYNGTEQSSDGFDYDNEDKVTVTLRQGESTRVVGTEPGTYHMGLTADSFDVVSANYEVTLEVTDGYLQIDPARTEAEIIADIDELLADPDVSTDDVNRVVENLTHISWADKDAIAGKPAEMARIYELEAVYISRNDTIDATQIEQSVAAGVTVSRVDGAALSVPVTDGTLHAVLSVERADVPAQSDLVNAVAIEMTLKVVDSDDVVVTGYDRIQPSAPLTVQFDVPAGIDADKLVIYHYPDGSTEPDVFSVAVGTITLNAEKTQASCTVSSLSRFVLGEAIIDISEVEVATVPDQTYTGSELTPEPTLTYDAVELEKGTDYILSYSDNISVGTATITITGAGSFTGVRTVNFKIVKAEATWMRLAGADRYSTMTAIVSEGFADTGGTVILTTGTGFPDALAASALAGLDGAPIVTTPPDSLGVDARAQIERLAPSRVIIIGGDAAVSSSVEQAVAELAIKPSVERIYGLERVATSYEIYKTGQGEWGSTCIIATASDFADALSISPYAYAKDAPLFLVGTSGSLTDEQVAAIRSDFERAIIVGGVSAVPAGVESQLSTLECVRLGGQTRYETSGDIATFALSEGLSVDGMAVATGKTFPDALTGGPLCGSIGSVIVLAANGNTSAIDTVVAANADRIIHGYIFGGDAAVSDSIESLLVSYTK